MAPAGVKGHQSVRVRPTKLPLRGTAPDLSDNRWGSGCPSVDTLIVDRTAKWPRRVAEQTQDDAGVTELAGDQSDAGADALAVRDALHARARVPTAALD